MTYEEALAYWFSHVNYEHRSPRAADLRLERMRTLVKRLGNPERRLRIVHIAGSKGKGSTSATLASILRCAGYRTGLFTSPHLTNVEERIQIDGLSISPAELTTLLEDIQTAAALDSEPPSFFEIATAAGFLHFVRRRVDVAVVEVGLGGRFDSTNVCLPLVSVITSISFDHTEQLGNRLSLIAMEKAGIVKPGRPAISGVVEAEPRTTIEAICQQRGSRLCQLGVDFSYRYAPAALDSQNNGRAKMDARVCVQTKSRTWPTLDLALIGEHQAANAAVAIACVEELRGQGLHIDDRAVADGLKEVRWPARLEVLGRRPLVILDCAHNVASAEALVNTLAQSFPSARRLLVFAGSGDKDVPGMFRVLGQYFDEAHMARYASSRRSLPPEHLGELWKTETHKPFAVHPSAEEAWKAAHAAAGPNDLICVTGSVFFAGELRPVLLQDQQISTSAANLTRPRQELSA